MKGETSREKCKTLPDDLVERIIAAVPFPHIFKARGLSKSWLARFSQVESLSDPAQKRRAISFQNLVRERSKEWTTFAPVSINSIAHNPASHTWQRMPSLRSLPWRATEYLEIKGPLLLASHQREFSLGQEIKRCRGEYSQRPGNYDVDDGDVAPMPHQLNLETELYVANMLTRSWKVLPPRPNADLCYPYREALVIEHDPSLETYLVVVFCRDHSPDGVCNAYSVQIYDSKSGDWSSNRLPNLSSHFLGLSSHAYYNGVIYIVESANMNGLLAYDVEARTWTKLHLGEAFHAFIDVTVGLADLVVCNSNLMMVVQEGEPDFVDALHVLKVDLERQLLWKVAKYPPIGKIRQLNFKESPPVSDGRCIFLGYDESDGKLVAKPVDEVIISLKEKRSLKKMKAKEQRQIGKMEMKERKQMRKTNKEMGKANKGMPDEDCFEEEDEEEDYEDEDEEDDEDETDFESEDEEIEDEDSGSDYQGDYPEDMDYDNYGEYKKYEQDEQEEWIRFDPPPPDREMTRNNFRDHNMQEARARGSKDQRGHYEWCGSSFQPGLNPFMAV